MSATMPQYFFRISHGRYAGASVQGMEFESHEAAWSEMRQICADLLVFRVRLIAESVGVAES